eukprot:scaffold129789_cov48-Phaeocystis_antarctica.AAC.1
MLASASSERLLGLALNCTCVQSGTASVAVKTVLWACGCSPLVFAALRVPKHLAPKKAPTPAPISTASSTPSDIAPRERHGRAPCGPIGFRVGCHMHVHDRHIDE